MLRYNAAMATLLHILAHPSPETSMTTGIATAFLDAYRETHPGDVVEVLDLYRDRVSYLTAAAISAMTKHDQPETMNDEERAAWEEITGHLRQFCGADKYLVTAPMWNLGVPAVLKAYIDQIVQAGITFRYAGPGMAVGMLAGRRMVVVSSRGGVYSQPVMLEFEMCVRFLRAIFGFIGIEVVGELVAEGLSLVGTPQQHELLEPVLRQARELAKHF
jgi:FMN-dependent NADH-azoreductase